MDLNFDLKRILNEVRKNSEYRKGMKLNNIIIKDNISISTSFGPMSRIRLAFKFNASKYEQNGAVFLVNHYLDNDSYYVFYDGKVYL